MLRNIWMRVKVKRDWADLAVIPLDNYFQCMTAGGTALHWIDERHTKTVYLSLFFSAPLHLCLFSVSLRLSLLLPVSLSHPFIMRCCCHHSERGVCVCLRDLLTWRSSTSFKKDLFLMNNVQVSDKKKETSSNTLRDSSCFSPPALLPLCHIQHTVL